MTFSTGDRCKMKSRVTCPNACPCNHSEETWLSKAWFCIAWNVSPFSTKASSKVKFELTTGWLWCHGRDIHAEYWLSTLREAGSRAEARRAETSSEPLRRWICIRPFLFETHFANYWSFLFTSIKIRTFSTATFVVPGIFLVHAIYSDAPLSLLPD